MKILLALVILVLSSLTTSAQNNECEYEKNELDKFTSKRIVRTKWEHLSPLIGREYAPDVKATIEDTLKELLVAVSGAYYTYEKPTQENLDQKFVIPMGSKLMILMEDQKPFELVTIKETKGFSEFLPPYSKDNKIDQYKILWQYIIRYPLNNNSIKKLSSQPSNSMRIYYSGEKYTDYNFGKKKYAVLQTLINCIK